MNTLKTFLVGNTCVNKKLSVNQWLLTCECFGVDSVRTRPAEHTLKQTHSHALTQSQTPPHLTVPVIKRGLWTRVEKQAWNFQHSISWAILVKNSLADCGLWGMFVELWVFFSRENGPKISTKKSTNKCTTKSTIKTKHQNPQWISGKDLLWTPQSPPKDWEGKRVLPLGVTIWLATLLTFRNQTTKITLVSVWVSDTESLEKQRQNKTNRENLIREHVSLQGVRGLEPTELAQCGFLVAPGTLFTLTAEQLEKVLFHQLKLQKPACTTSRAENLWKLSYGWCALFSHWGVVGTMVVAPFAIRWV